MKFLQQDSPIVRLLNLFMDLVLLNVVWVVCSLPVFTMGASLTALYDMTMKMALHEEGSLLRDFFRSFSRHFKRATPLFLLALGVGLFIAADLWCAAQWDTSFRFLLLVTILAITYFYVALVSHLFPALAYFGEGGKQTIRRAFVLAMKNGVFTVFIMVLDLLPLFILLFAPSYAAQALFVYLIIGFALTAYLNSLHLVRLFDPQKVQEMEEQEGLRRTVSPWDNEDDK